MHTYYVYCIHLLLCITQSAANLSLTLYPAASVTYGSTLTAQCSVQSSSIAFIQLMITGQVCASSSCANYATLCAVANSSASFQCAYTTQNGIYTLTTTFSNIQYFFTNKTIQCVSGALSSNAASTFIYGTPVVSVSIAQSTVLQGQNGVLTCTITSSTQVNTNTIGWQLNGQTYTANGVRVLSSVQTFAQFPYLYSATLNFSTTQVADSGSYACVAANTYGATTSNAVSLSVVSAPQSVIFSFGTSPVQFVNGLNVYNERQSVALLCTVNGGSPTSTTTFFKRITTATNGNNDVQIQSPYLIMRGDNSYVFLCRATNAATQLAYASSGGYLTSATVAAIVYFPPSSSLQLSPSPSIQLNENASATITCQTTSSSLPAPVISWSIVNSAGLTVGSPSSSAVSQQQTAADYNSFSVSSTVALGSNYTSRSNNAFSFVCTLLYLGQSLTQSATTLNITFAPTINNFVTSPSSLFGAIQYGTQIVLTCSSDASNPPTSVQWSYYRSNIGTVNYGQSGFPSYVQIQTSTSISTYNGTATWSQLSFAAQPTDNGANYACSYYQNNAFLVTRQFSYMTILYPPQVSISFTVTSGNSLPSTGLSVSLTCSISDYGNPSYSFPTNSLTYSWYRTASLSSPSQNLSSYTNLNFASSTYHISSVQYSNIANYICQIETPIGNIQSSPFALNTSYPPTLNPSEPSQSVIYSAVGAAVQISFSIVSNPLPTAYQWYFVDSQTLISSPVTSNGQYSTSQSGWQKFTLTILAVQQNNYGTYSCLLTQAQQSPQFIFQLQSSNNSQVYATTAASVTDQGLDQGTLIAIVCGCVGGVVLVAVVVTVVLLIQRRKRLHKKHAQEAACSSTNQMHGTQNGAETSVAGVVDYSVVSGESLLVGDDSASLAFSSVSQQNRMPLRREVSESQNSVNHTNTNNNNNARQRTNTLYDRQAGRPLRNARYVSASNSDLASAADLNSRQPIHGRLSGSAGLNSHVGLATQNSLDAPNHTVNHQSRIKSTSQNSLDSQPSRNTALTILTAPSAPRIPNPLNHFSTSAGNLSAPLDTRATKPSYTPAQPRALRSQNDARTRLPSHAQPPQQHETPYPPPPARDPPTTPKDYFDPSLRYLSADSSGYSSSANQDNSPIVKSNGRSDYPMLPYQSPPSNYYRLQSSDYPPAFESQDYV